MKELSIRGDFHSTGEKQNFLRKHFHESKLFVLVEILIRLLETDIFVNNEVKTSWLDDLIADRFQTEKPDTMISLVCGATHIADEQFRTHFQNFRSSLER